MNAHAFFPKAETARHRFTVDDVDRMVETGLIAPDARMEILDGELLDMASEGETHLTFKMRLNRALILALGSDWDLMPDGTLHLGPEDAPQPDFYVLKAGAALKPVDPATVVLIIEIADTSIAHDLGRKSGKYAQYGLVEYWVVDTNARHTHVLSSPADGVYHDIRSVPFDVALSPQCLRGVSLIIDDIVPPVG